MVTFSPFDKWEYLTDLETCHAYIREQDSKIEEMRDILKINTEQQAEHIKTLLESWEKERKILTDQIKSLRHRVDHAEWLVEKYRYETND